MRKPGRDVQMHVTILIERHINSFPSAVQDVMRTVLSTHHVCIWSPVSLLLKNLFVERKEKRERAR